MNKRYSFVISVMTMMGWSYSWGSASFDCQSAKSSSEKMICSSDELCAIDRKMSSVYKLQIKYAGKFTARFRKQQNAWLKQRDSCKEPECLKEEYLYRLEDIFADLQESAVLFRERSADDKAVFFDARLFFNYETLNEQLYTERSNSALTPGSDFIGIPMYKTSTQESRHVNNCSEFLLARNEGFLPGPQNWIMNFADCSLINVLNKVKKSEHSFIDEENIVKEIKSYLGPLEGTIAFTSSSYKINRDGPDPEQERMRLIALGDFNGDGYEDILFALNLDNQGGTRWYVGSDRYQILTRKSDNGPFVEVMAPCGLFVSCVVR